MKLDASLLLQPFRLGDLDLPNRIVMAPLTRNRATHGTDAPNELAAHLLPPARRRRADRLRGHADQPAGPGLYLDAGLLYSEAQVEGWRKVTDAVHEAGGRIFLQLWHVGRISHISLQPGGGAPVAPSAIRAKTKTFIEGGFAEVSEPRALQIAEIAAIVARLCASRAKTPSAPASTASRFTAPTAI